MSQYDQNGNPTNDGRGSQPPAYPQGGHDSGASSQGGHGNGYPTAPQGGGYNGNSGYNQGVSTSYPGKVLGIVGFVISFLGAFSIVGLILSIIALVQSKKAGRGNGFAVAGIIIGAIVTVLVIIGVVVLVAVGANLAEVCSNNGNGTFEIDGTTYSCSGY